MNEAIYVLQDILQSLFNFFPNSTHSKVRPSNASCYQKFIPNITKCYRRNQPKTIPNVISGFNSNTVLCYRTSNCFILSVNEFIVPWDCLQISLLTLSEFKRIN